MDDDYLQPQKATAWSRKRKLPAIEQGQQRELVRIASAVYQAICDDEDSPPREVRVYYQALKFIASVAGAPECREWYGSDPLPAEQAPARRRRRGA
jgi:hypothetical protein